MPLSETELFIAYLDGDTDAFSTLFQRVAPKLMRVMYRGLPASFPADELVQETFLRAIRSGRDFDRSRPLLPWLFTIALNVRREAARRSRRRPNTDTETTPDTLPARSDNWARAYDARRQIDRALATLPESQRSVIELHWFGGLAFSEVAEVLGIRLSAAKVRAHRGYKAMRAQLESESE